MKILVWNVRGLNHPLKHKEVVARITKLSVNFVCLLETHVKQNKMQNIIKKSFPCWNSFNNYSNAYNDRIWVLWKDDVKANLLATSDQSITCCVEVGMQKFYCSVIYGYNESRDRRKLWSHLLSIHSTL